MDAPIRLYLISGFLGAGKTTFLRSLISVFSGSRLGVLVNEFGSIGIDGTLVNQSGMQLVEINDGSIFCACIKDGFVRTLKAFTQQPIDLLLIESSGMADPAGMNTILNGLAPYLDRPYDYMGSVCLVDATTFLDYAEVLMPIQNQVAAADFILVNKTDLVDGQRLEEVHRGIRRLNAEAPLHDTLYAHVPREQLEEKLSNRGFEGEGSNTPYNRPGTYTMQTDAPQTPDALTAFYTALEGRVLRVKGFLPAAGGGWHHVEGVADQFTLEPADFTQSAPPPRGRLVVIAAGAGDISEPVTTAWAGNCAGAMELTAT